MFRCNNWQDKLTPALQEARIAEGKNNLCRVMVELSGANTTEITSVVTRNRGRIHREVKLLPGIVAEIPYGSLEELAKLDIVIKIWPDTQVTIKTIEKVLNPSLPGVEE